jgi:hypothetical protein
VKVKKYGQVVFGVVEKRDAEETDSTRRLFDSGLHMILNFIIKE